MWLHKLQFLYIDSRINDITPSGPFSHSAAFVTKFARTVADLHITSNHLNSVKC
jgi:hypothetical protein